MPGAAGACRRLIDLGELRRRVEIREPPGDGRGKRHDAIEILVVDLVRRVGRPVIVDVGAGEERQRRHAGLIEGGDVGRLIGILLHLQVESGGDVRLLEDLRPRRRGAGGLDGQLVVLHAADHVEVQIGGDLIDRHRRLGGKRRRAEQPELFARPEVEQHVAPARLFGQRLADRQHRRRSRRVVVGAGVDPARLFLARERAAAVAVAEMIVVRPERDPRLLHARRRRRGRQVGDDVVPGLLLALDRCLDVRGDAGQVESRDVRVSGIERLLRVLERLVLGAREQRLRRLAGDADPRRCRNRRAPCRTSSARARPRSATSGR